MRALDSTIRMRCDLVMRVRQSCAPLYLYKQPYFKGAHPNDGQILLQPITFESKGKNQQLIFHMQFDYYYAIIVIVDD